MTVYGTVLIPVVVLVEYKVRSEVVLGTMLAVVDLLDVLHIN